MATVDALLRRCFLQRRVLSGHDSLGHQRLPDARHRPNAAARRRSALPRADRSVARLASPTGQWPEAIHPQSGGGCMGDGQHGWAAAEWVMMMRNCFVREEGDRLIIGSGIVRGVARGRRGAVVRPDAHAVGTGDGADQPAHARADAHDRRATGEADRRGSTSKSPAFASCTTSTARRPFTLERDRRRDRTHRTCNAPLPRESQP